MITKRTIEQLMRVRSAHERFTAHMEAVKAENAARHAKAMERDPAIVAMCAPGPEPVSLPMSDADYRAAIEAMPMASETDRQMREAAERARKGRAAA